MTEILTPGAPALRYAVAPLLNAEWRDKGETGDGSYTLTGHAAVFEQETVLFDIGWYRLREKIARGAFTSVLSRRPDVHFNHGHDMNTAMARTSVRGIGSLELTQDEIGLRVFARLDPADLDVQRLAPKMDRGIVDQMSFAFMLGDYERVEEEDADGNTDVLRTIVEVGDLYDVCVCAQGAYPTTDAALALRTMNHILGRAGIDPAGLLEHRAEAGASDVAPDELAGDGDTKARSELTAMRMQLELARTHL
jgi:HK97 family phage prohead protease